MAQVLPAERDLRRVIGDADGGQISFEPNDPRTFIAPNQSFIIRSTVVAPTALSGDALPPLFGAERPPEVALRDLLREALRVDADSLRQLGHPLDQLLRLVARKGAPGAEDPPCGREIDQPRQVMELLEVILIEILKELARARRVGPLRPVRRSVVRVRP